MSLRDKKSVKKYAQYVKLEGQVQLSMQCALVVYCTYGRTVTHRSFEYFMHTGNVHIVHSIFIIYRINTW